MAQMKARRRTCLGLALNGVH